MARSKKSKKRSSKETRRKSRRDAEGEDEALEQQSTQEEPSDNVLKIQKKRRKSTSSRSKKEKKKAQKRRKSEKSSASGSNTDDSENASPDNTPKSNKEERPDADERTSSQKNSAVITLETDSKETFAELQLRRAQNVAKCQQALSIAFIVGFILIVVSVGLFIAFAYGGRCSDPLFPYMCNSFDCCSQTCTAVSSSDNPNGECVITIVNPIEAVAITLIIVGFLTIAAVVICCIQVNRVAQLRWSPQIFGFSIVIGVILILVSIIAFVIVAANSWDDELSMEGNNNMSDSILPTSEVLMTVALTMIWPGAVLVTLSIIIMYIMWRSQATTKKHQVLVFGLPGSGKSYVTSGIMSAAEKMSGGQSSGTIYNMGGQTTNGIFAQEVMRSDGHSLQLIEVGDAQSSQKLM